MPKAKAVIDVPLNPRDQFFRLCMFEYASENARTLCLSAFEECVWSDSTERAAIK